MRRPISLGAFLFVLHVVNASAQSYTFDHFVGSPYGNGSVDGTGADARFYEPFALTYASGALYACDSQNFVIRRVALDGSVSTFVGLAGNSASVNGRRYLARAVTPRGIAADSAGNFYVSWGDQTIRKITPGGNVVPFVGAVNMGGSTNGTGTVARFDDPQGLATDSSDNIYVADVGNHIIRKVTPAGVVTTLAGTAGTIGSANGTGAAASFNRPSAVAVNRTNGIVYVSDRENHTIRQITPGGEVTTLAGSPGLSGRVDMTGSDARFSQPMGLVVSTAGEVFVADSNNYAVRKVTAAGAVTTIAGDGTAGSADGTGSSARFQKPNGLAIDAGGDLYVGDLAIRKVTQAGVVTTLAGRMLEHGTADGAASAARFSQPAQMVVDSSNNIYLADEGNHTIRKITPAGLVTTLAGSGAPGSSNGTGSGASFNSPRSVAYDSGGNVYVADRGNHLIRKITSAGVVTTLAGSAGMSGSANGTGAAARFNGPEGVAVDSVGNIMVADTGNHIIRRITPTGIVTTPLGTAGIVGSTDGTGSVVSFNYPKAITADSSGVLYVADYINSTVRRIASDVVTTYAGSAENYGNVDATGTAARLFFPLAITCDGLGNVYVVGDGNNVRKITTARVVTSIGGKFGYAGSEDGTGEAARFYRPSGVAVDSIGRIYVSDWNNMIRRSSVALSDSPTIDLFTAGLHEQRQLGVFPSTATSWTWSIIRKPAGSATLLSATNISNPTFVPDIPDQYVFRLKAATASQSAVRDITFVGACPSISLRGLPDGTVDTPYSGIVSVFAGTAPVQIEVLSGDLPTGLTLGGCGPTSCILSGTPTAAGIYEFTVRAADYYGCSVDRLYGMIIGVLPMPAGLQATTMTASSVSVTWSAAAGANSYNVYRRTVSPGFFQLRGNTPDTFFDDVASATTAYVYAVRAVNGSGGESGNSNLDTATTHTFAENVNPGVIVRLSHLFELQNAASALRALTSGSPFGFSDPLPSIIKRVHLAELRDVMNMIHFHFGMTALVYTDPTITPGVTTVKAAHVNELRTASH